MAFKDHEKQKKFVRDWLKKRRDAWFVDNGPCRQCGSWERLELDHIDPALKVSHTIWSWSKEKREAELAKCQPLCYGCHKKKTAEFNRRPLSHGSAGYSRGCRCQVCAEYQAKRMEKYHAAHPRKKFHSGVAQAGSAPVL